MKIFLVLMVYANVILSSIYGQTNLISNGSFELANPDNSNNCQYDQDGFNAALSSWNCSHNNDNCKSGEAPYLITPVCYSYYETSFDDWMYPRPKFYGIIGSSMSPGNLIFLYVDQKCHTSIRESMHTKLKQDVTYVFKLKVYGVNLNTHNTVNTASILNIYFSKFGDHWNCVNCNNQLLQLADIEINTNSSSDWKQYYYEFTVPHAFDELDNIILHQAQMGAFIDDIELYEKSDYYCSDKLFVQNKIYDGYFYNPIYQGIPFITSAQNYLIAGYSVDASQNNGNVIIKSGANITYTAGDVIYLDDGFIVNPGSNFDARIASCSSNKTPIISSNNNLNEGVLANTNKTIAMEKLNNQLSISINPNPSKGILNLIFNGGILENSNLLVYDMIGNIVKSESLKIQQTQQIDLSNLEIGMYYLRVFNNEQSFSEKIVIQR